MVGVALTATTVSSCSCVTVASWVCTRVSCWNRLSASNYNVLFGPQRQAWRKLSRLCGEEKAKGCRLLGVSGVGLAHLNSLLSASR